MATITIKSGPARIDTRAVKARIGQRADDFMHALYGENAKRSGADQWRVGTRGSLVINRKAGELVWFDHEHGKDSIGNDAIALWQREHGCTAGDAIKACSEWAGGAALPSPPARALKPKPDAAFLPVALPPGATPGTEADWTALAALRALPSAMGTATAAHMGTLWFGDVCGHRSWMLTDIEGRAVEARRMDGEKYAATDHLPARKVHTLKGSKKTWPLGLTVKGYAPQDFRAILLVEGMPDYLAAMEFTMSGPGDCLPAVMLGAGVQLPQEAVARFSGLRVRIYPHADASGAGAEAAKRWATQLRAVGATVDAFGFAGLRKSDGSPVKDLNDCTSIHPDDAQKLEGLLP